MDSDEFVPFTSSKEKNVDGNTLCSTGTSSESLHSLMTDVRAPWMAFSQSGLESDSSSSSLVRLHNEILTFCEYVSPTKVVLNKQYYYWSWYVRKSSMTYTCITITERNGGKGASCTRNYRNSQGDMVNLMHVQCHLNANALHFWYMNALL
jgi:hypothetical protein